MTCRAAFECEAFILTADAERTAPSWFCVRARQGLIQLDFRIVDGASKFCGCTIQTGRGNITASVGDYIVKYPNGHLFPFDKKTYERLFLTCT